MAPQSRAGSRSANACDQCRKRKVKCCGTRPCRPCTRRNVDCTLGGAGRQRYSDAYVQSLLHRLNEHERNSPVAASEQEPGLIAPEEPIRANPSSRTENASGPVFASQVRSLFGQQSTETTSIHTTTGTSMETPSPSLTDARLQLPLPSEEESLRLLDLFLTHIGTAQHFLDPRMFSDAVALLYHSSETRNLQISTVWFTQYLLVIALAKLADIETIVHDGEPPGGEFFAEAMRRLPAMHRLTSCGVVAVELLCLIGVHFQWCDWKRDAYFYIGNAVRLAIAQGYHLPASKQDCLPSERAHRTRVWWTAYMLDRRISAAVGLPAAADDRQLAFELPVAAPGFPSPDGLNIKVRIAHATGEIMASLYGNAALSEEEFVAKIQSVLRSLNATRKSIPTRYVLDFRSSQISVDRTRASLYLMLFQAIILCIRPVVLQKAKEKLHSRPQRPGNAAMTNLCQSCKDAAKKSIRILRALQDSRQISRFGFFDLDATFSAAFILIMQAFLEGTPEGKPAPAEPSYLEEAITVLEHLSSEGNKVARQRLSDVKDFSNQVLSVGEIRRPDISNSEHRRRVESSNGLESSPVAEPRLGLNRGGATRRPEAVAEGADGLTDFPISDLINDMDFNLDWEAAGIFTSFHDPRLPVTGVDQIDWEEMERMFAAA